MDNQAFRGSHSGNQEAEGAQKAGKGEGNYFDKWGWKPLGPSGDRGPFHGSGYPLGLLGQAALFLLVAAVVFLAIPFGSGQQKPEAAQGDQVLQVQEAKAVGSPETGVGSPENQASQVSQVKMESYLDLINRSASAEMASLAEHEDWVRDFTTANQAIAEVKAGYTKQLSDASINVIRRLETQKTTKEKKDALVLSLSSRFDKSYAEVHRLGVQTTSGIGGLVNKAWGYSIEGDERILKNTGGVALRAGMTKDEYAAALLKSIKSDYRRLGAYYLASRSEIPVFEVLNK